MPCLGFRKVFNVWLGHVSLRSLGRASQLQRTKHDTSADPRRAFCCCRQCFKKPQDHICLSPTFYRFFTSFKGKDQNCSCFIFEHAWIKLWHRSVLQIQSKLLMRVDDQYFCLRLCLAAEKGVDLFSLHGKHEKFLFSLYFQQDEQGWSKSVSQVKKSWANFHSVFDGTQAA